MNVTIENIAQCVGKKVRITERLRIAGEVYDGSFVTTIAWAEPREAGVYFGFGPTYEEDGRYRSTFGCAWLRPTQRPFGVRSVEVIS